MNHFFVDPKHIEREQVRFPSDLSHQINRVLRLKVDDHVIVLDNSGKQFEVQLLKVDSQGCVGEILIEKDNIAEPTNVLHLFVAFTQREKFEWILQKCCELGVQKFTPILSERTVVTSMKDFSKKKERWEKILKEASEQSRRGKIPELHEPMPFNRAVSTQGEHKLIAWENEENLKVDDILKNPQGSQVFLMIGPEGGFSQQEVEIAKRNDWLPISLGKRILRMETAAVVATTLIMNAMGEL